MRIVVAAAAFSSEMCGVQRHAFNMVRCLLQSAEISSIQLVVAPWQRKLLASAGLEASDRLKTHLAPMERSSLSRNLWYYRELPLLAAREQADLVHLTYPVPVNGSAFSCPTVVTLHDLYPYEIPRNFGVRQILFHRLILQQCLRGVDAIACVSQVTSHRLRQYAPSSTWRKAVQIYNCVEAPQLCAVQAPIPGWQDEPFLLCIAQHRRNKNIPLLLRTFARLLHRRQIDLEMKLVVIGIAGPETHRIHRLVSRLDLGQKVYLLEGLSEEELQWCYARCKALVLPSMTEGFGLPAAEALLAGCRVVCSDIPAFREIGEGHCRFVDMTSDAEAELATAIVDTLREPPKPPIALPQLSAQALAGQYAGLYRELIASASPTSNARYSRAIHMAASERQS